jgi:hypothetical protein
LLEDNDPLLKKKLNIINNNISEYSRINYHQSKSPKEIIYIPVVVHILYNTAEENLSDEQVYAQIWSLNQDFRHKNGDSVNTPAIFKARAADCGIEFCMAVRTPENQPTNGIIRTFTNKTEFGLDNSVKSIYQGGDSAWDSKSYLNIWVCNISGNYLGYAQYPGGPDSTDGVVIDYKVFGFVNVLHPHYNLGRTATHEVGHWLDLYHIWGDDFGSCEGSDYVDDTPNAKDANYYCPTHPHTTICNDTGEMFMNYMDYVYDGCFNLYTIGQRERMLSAISLYRADLLVSDGCSPVIGIDEGSCLESISIQPNPSGGDYVITGFNSFQRYLEIRIYNVWGIEILHKIYNNQNATAIPIQISDYSAGTYFLKLSNQHSERSFKLIKL